VVCTNVGYAGLELLPNEGVALSNSTQEFINNTVHILQNETFRNDLGSKGGEKIRDKFSWQGIAKKLEKYLQEVSI
jgi:glycosyltransferase involved in cell wall biosynthesis